MTRYTVTARQGLTRLMAAVVAETPEQARAEFRGRYPLATHIRIREYRGDRPAGTGLAR